MPDTSNADSDGTPTEQRRRFRRGWFIAGVVVLVVFGGGFAACAAITSCLDNYKLNLLGPPLKPIPVPRSSCPYLRQVHDTAEAAGKTWSLSGAVSPGGKQRDNPKAWPFYRALFRARFMAFDRALRNAGPHVPAKIETSLGGAQYEVEFGLAQLPRATTAGAYGTRTFDAVTSGYFSLSNASALTGNACGFTLAPDPGVALGGDQSTPTN